MSTNVWLNEWQRELLAEGFNIGIGAAAGVLSEMVGEQVLMSVPSIEASDSRHTINYIQQWGGGGISGIAQSFRGGIDGEALLLFNDAGSLELVRCLLKNTLDMPVPNISELEQEAFLELGNIIINCTLSALADLLGVSFVSELPQAVSGGVDKIEEMVCRDGSDILMVFVTFKLAQRNIEGLLIYLVDVNSMALLRQMLSAVRDQFDLLGEV